MNNGTVEFVDFEGGEALVIPTGEGGGPRQFKEPSVATVTLQHEDSMCLFRRNERTREPRTNYF